MGPTSRLASTGHWLRDRVGEIAWGSAVIGGVLGLVVVLLFALIVADSMTSSLAWMGAPVVYGLMVLVLALLRVVAGSWTAQLVRRRYETRRRLEFVPTGLAAGAIGWALYTALVMAGAAFLGDPTDTAQLVLDLLPWLAEFGLGAFLISPTTDTPEQAQARRRALLAAGQQHKAK